MGIKGDKLSRDAILSADLLSEKLSVIAGISTKKMFGGHGVFHEGKMFGIIDSKGNLFFKVNESNKADYEQKGASQHSRMPYFSVPKQIFDNQEDLILWAQKSIEASK